MRSAPSPAPAAPFDRAQDKLAREAGMNRQALHKALSEDGNPTLETVLKVLKALGLQMRIEAAEAA